MKVKGTAIKSLPAFILNRFGADALDQWIESLDNAAKRVYLSGILATGWYPFQEILIEPTARLCELFFNGNIREGSFESGAFSAEYALSSVYKGFLQENVPGYIIEKTSMIMQTYFSPCRAELVESAENSALIRVLEFPGMCEIMEYRIQGWMQKGLAICNVSNPSVQILHTMIRDQIVADFLASWE